MALAVARANPRDGFDTAWRGMIESQDRRRHPKSDDVDLLVPDYSAGIPVGMIAEKYGIHLATVTGHLRRREIPAPAAGLDPGQRAEALHLYREGL